MYSYRWLSLKLRKHIIKPITTKITTLLGGRVTHPQPYGDDGEPLSPAARLFHAPKFNCFIIAVLGCKTKINPEVVKDGLKQTLLVHPRFTSIMVVDDKRRGRAKARWIKTTADLEYHVHVPDLDPNSESADELIEDYISDLTQTQLDLSRPLWEIHLLNVKSSHSQSLAIFRIHHSIGDGASLTSLLLACTRKTSDLTALPTVPSTKHAPSTLRPPCFWALLVFINWVFWLLWNSIVDLVMFSATATPFLQDSKTPIKAGPDVAFSRKLFARRFISMDDIKLVKKAMNMTINDVLLGITQAGLSRYLNRRYADDNKKDEGATEKRNNLPKRIRLRATLAFNIRPSAGIQVLADMMENKSKVKWGNHIGYVLFPFTIGFRDDPLDYFHNAKAAIDRKKQSLESVFSFSFAQIFSKLFGDEAGGSLSHNVLCNTTVLFSNVPGPLEEITFYGHPIAYLAPSAYGVPQALTMHFQSYVDKMTISLAVEPNVIPDHHQLFDDFEYSLKLIKDAVIERGLVK